MEPSPSVIAIANPIKVTRKPSSKLQNTEGKLHRYAWVFPNFVSLDPHHRENGSKYDDEGGVEELRHGRGHGPAENVSAHISVCEQRQEVPACSKHAQKTMLMIMKMTRAIIRLAIFFLLEPARTSDAATRMNNPVSR